WDRDAAVLEEQGARPRRIPTEKDLCDRSAAVVRDEVHSIDREPLEKGQEHVSLRTGCETLRRIHLRMPEPHRIGGDATTLPRQLFDHAAPLKAAQRESVKEERDRTPAPLETPARLDVRDAPEVRRDEVSLAIVATRQRLVLRPARRRERLAKHPDSKGACHERPDRHRHKVSSSHVSLSYREREQITRSAAHAVRIFRDGFDCSRDVSCLSPSTGTLRGRLSAGGSSGETRPASARRAGGTRR